MLDDLLGERPSHPGDVRQELRARRVELDPHGVDAALDHLVELSHEELRLHIVLVLPDADRLRIDLYELRQRILQAARDRDGPANRQIELRELFARDVARRIHARARLAHENDERRRPGRLHDIAAEIRRLAAVRAVADGDRERPPTREEREQCVLCRGERPFAGDQVQNGTLDQLAGVVDDGALASGALPRVDPEHDAAAERGRKQQAPQVLGEDRHCVAIR